MNCNVPPGLKSGGFDTRHECLRLQAPLHEPQAPCRALHKAPRGVFAPPDSEAVGPCERVPSGDQAVLPGNSLVSNECFNLSTFEGAASSTALKGHGIRREDLGDRTAARRMALGPVPIQSGVLPFGQL
jgi:hypothetical protein